MCGIVGTIRLDGVGIDLAELRTVTAMVGHRGPDGSGYLLAALDGSDPVVAYEPHGAFIDPRWWAGPPPASLHIALGFQRLAIIEPGEKGQQPMGTVDGTRWIVNNGEIYNYLELRRQLAREGVSFSSVSDTEVLLHGLDRWGVSFLRGLTGMFAFAYLDLGDRTLTLARDSFGIKPLYMAVGRSRIAFASEIGALLKFSWVGREVDPSSLRDYLTLGVTSHRTATLLSSISEVPPAHAVTFDLSPSLRLTRTRYWSIDLASPRTDTFADVVAHTRSLFLESVNLHMRSDVPIAATLSGGIDSSAIVAAMRHLGGPDLPLATFGYIADDEARNEEHWIDLIGAATSATVSKVRLDTTTLADDVERLIELQGEPFGGPSIVAQWRLYQAVKQAGFKVVLDGQGADEPLGGYRTALPSRFVSLIRQGRWGRAARFLYAVARLPGSSVQEAVLGALRLNLDTSTRLRTIIPFGDGQWFDERCGPPQPWTFSDDSDVLRAQLRHQVEAVDLPFLLRIADRNAMASSVENRVPFLAPSLAEFLLSLKEEFLIGDDGTTKRVFRKAMGGLVPDAVLDRTDKIGFATVDPSWVPALAPWLDRVILGDATRNLPALCHSGLDRAWRAIKEEAARGRVDPRFDCTWRWANLASWAEVFDVRFPS